MIFFRKPGPRQLRGILEACRADGLSYAEVGATRAGRIPGYPVNHHRVRLGTGEGDFERARAALGEWAMYRTGWTELHPARPEILEGRDLLVVARHPGFWSVNPCRLVYRLEEAGAVVRTGYAIGTLPGHLERGEERFHVEWQRGDDSVWFELLASAAAAHPLLKLGYPLLRLGQKVFGRGALRAMRAAVKEPEL
jgi:uncharacterized protein (UPF0548 family)